MPNKLPGLIQRAAARIIDTLIRFFTTIGVWTLGLILLFEEWGWEYLAALAAWIGRLPGLRWIQHRISELPPYGALALFAIPVLALLPVKLLALYWLAHGHRLLGIGVIIAAKVGGTALTARLFMLTRPTLMRLPWFARWFARWMAFKDRVLARVKSSAAWRQWLRARMAAKALWRRATRWWRQR